MSRPGDDWPIRVLQVTLFGLCLLPALDLLRGVLSANLGANPVEHLLHATGDWALWLLLATLAMTPARRLTGWGSWVRQRRLLGLFAFFYASLHLMVYLGLDRALVWSTILADVWRRPYITVGLAAFVLLVPLALTSSRGWMRRLGRHWKRLHRVIYLVAILAVLHYLWLVKADRLVPLIHAGILALLLFARLPGLQRGSPLRRKRTQARSCPQKL